MIAALGVAAVAITLAVTWALWPREQAPESSDQTLPARQPAAVTEFPLCTPKWAEGTAGSLSLSGDLVVWDEPKKDRSGLFAADVRVHERFRLRPAAKGVFEHSPVVGGRVLAWTERTAQEEEELARLWVARPIDGRPRLAGEAVRLRDLDVSGDLVVWLQRVQDEEAPDDRDDQVWVYDLGRGESERLPAAAGPKTAVAVDGGLVTWSVADEDADGEVGVWVHDTTTGQTRQAIGNGAASVDISGARLVWCSAAGDVYGYDLRSRERFRVCTAPGRQAGARIDGDLVVWWDARASASAGSDGGRSSARGDIYALDLSTGDEVPICTNKASQEEPRVSGDTVVWLDDRTGSWTIRGAVVHR